MKTIKQLTAGVVIASLLFATSAYAFDLSSVVHLDAGTKNMLSNLQFMANGGKVASLDQMTPATLSQCSASSEMYSPDNKWQAQAYIQRFQSVTAKYKAVKNLTPDQALEVTCAALPLMRYLEQVDRARDAQQAQSTLNADAAKVKSLAATTKTLQAEVAQGTIPASLHGNVTQAADQVAASEQILAAVQSRDLANTDTAVLTRNLDTEIRAAYRPLQTGQMRSYATRAGLTPYTRSTSYARQQTMMPVNTVMIFVDRNGNVRDPGKEVLTGMQVTPKLVDIYRDANGKLVDGQGRLVDARGYPLHQENINSSERDFIDNLLMDGLKLLADHKIDGSGKITIPPFIKSKALQDALRVAPFLGNSLCMVEAATGRVWFTGTPLTPAQRLVSLIGILPEGGLGVAACREIGLTSDIALQAARTVDRAAQPRIVLTANLATSDTVNSAFNVIDQKFFDGKQRARLVTDFENSISSTVTNYLPNATNTAPILNLDSSETLNSVKQKLHAIGGI